MEDTSSADEGGNQHCRSRRRIKNGLCLGEIARHYAVWSSYSVNPYRIDGTAIDDVAITLYDSTKGRNWIMPLRKIYKTSGFAFRNIRWHYGVDLDLKQATVSAQYLMVSCVYAAGMAVAGEIMCWSGIITDWKHFMDTCRRPTQKSEISSRLAI